MALELKKTILTMLKQHNTLTIATANKQGKPEAAAVFYASKELDLYFLSKPTSRHAENIGSGLFCAVTIQKDYQKWQEIEGLQLEGWVQPVQSTIDKSLALKYYLGKFGFLQDVLSEGHALYQAFQKAKIYKISPEVIWVTDNNFTFGKRREFVVGK